MFKNLKYYRFSFHQIWNIIEESPNLKFGLVTLNSKITVYDDWIYFIFIFIFFNMEIKIIV